MTERMTMNQEENRRAVASRRLNVVFFGIFMAMAGLILRLSLLQLAEGPSLRQQESESHFDTLVVPAARGWIYDAKGKLLATDRQTFTITYTKMPSNVQNKKSIAALLAPIFHLTVAQVLGKMNTLSSTGAAQMRLFTEVDAKQVSFVAERQHQLPGIHVVVDPTRRYQLGSNGKLAAHVIGYVGSIPARQAASYAKMKYPPDADVGLDGIELQYESYLKGRDGALKVELNKSNQPIRSFAMSPAPIKGDDLVLNIDTSLQEVLQKALQTQVEYLQSNGQPYVHNAVAVAMDPNTGAILAMDSYPSYQPQWFVGGITESNYRRYGANLAAIDLATQGLYAPGSTEKPATLMMALQDGYVTANKTIQDPGYYDVGSTRMNDWVPYGHGMVNAVEALRESCDTYFYWLSTVMGHYPPTTKSVGNWMATDRVAMLGRLSFYQSKVGLGALTGIDLPNEQQGFNYDNKTLGALPLAAMGQSEEFTDIELAQYTSAIANGGKRMEPHIVKEILSPDKTVQKKVEPKVLNTIPVSAFNLNTIRQGMYEVCNDPLGTAYSVWLNRPYKVAGKTGTSQTHRFYGSREIEDSVFIGYAPFDKPKIAVAVIVPGGGEGYMSSGPIARAIFDAFFGYKVKETPTTAPGHWG